MRRENLMDTRTQFLAVGRRYHYPRVVLAGIVVKPGELNWHQFANLQAPELLRAAIARIEAFEKRVAS